MKLLISNITPDNRLLLDGILDLCELAGYGSYNSMGQFFSFPFSRIDGIVDFTRFYDMLEKLTENDFKVEILK